jgi:hypothetical protein
MTRVEMYPEWRPAVELAAGPGVRRKAERVLDYAVSIAPVDTGEYKSKLRLVELESGWRIEALAPHSIYVEFGTRKMAAYHTLAVALDAAKG